MKAEELTLTDVLMYILPALVVMAAMFYVIKRFLDRDHNVRMVEARKEAHKTLVPLKLQAYERLCVFLERISPPSLLPRVLTHGMSAARLRSELVNNINTEFEHNVSQQIYVSENAWKMVRNSKEETIHLIHNAYDKLPDSSNGIELSRSIYEHIAKSGSMPTDSALSILRLEAGKLI
jgi:hypothetical protein